jgi:hypothetical protein
MTAASRRALWGVVGVTAILVEAEVRLFILAWKGTAEHFEGPVAAAALAWCALNAWLEGYRGFQKRFVPQAIARAWSIAPDSMAETLLAPVKVLGLWRTERKVMQRAWLLVLGITALVLIVRHLAQPWRGVVDAGVVAGLLWGTVALWVQFVRSWRRVSKQ